MIGDKQFIPADFARTLERELAAEKAETKRLGELCDLRYRTMETTESRFATMNAKLSAAHEEVATLKAALALGQENCDAEYERLREERDEALEDTKRLDWLHLTADGINWQLHNTNLITREALDAARKGQP